MNNRILIIEDESIEAMNFEQSLKSFGYDVVGIASTGEEAIKKATELKPDLILMDIILKGDMDGVEATSKIKENLNIPVVYLTAHPEESTVNRAKLTTPHGYLIKPVNKTVLKNTIDIAIFRHKMDMELQDSEERYKMLFENSQVSTAITSMDGKVITANERFFKMVGHSKAEMNSIDLKTMYHDVNQRKYIIETLKSGGKISDYEVQLKRKDGSHYVNSINVDIIRYHGEDAMLVTAIDITERKKAQISLNESEERYKGLFNYMSSGVAIYSAIDNGKDFIFKDFNKAAEKIEDIKKEDVLEKRVSEVFPGVKDFGLLEVFERVYKTGNPENHPISHYKDNRIAGWRDNFVYRLPSGEIISVYEDVTEQKQAEEALYKSEEFNRSIISSSPDCIKVLDLDGNLLYMSEGGQKVMEVDDVSVILDTNLINFYSDEFKPDARAAISLASKGDVGHFRGYCPTLKGTPKWWDVIVTPVLDPEGNPDKLTAVSRDITDIIRAEKAIKESEKKFKVIFEQAPVGMVLSGPDRRIFKANEAFKRMLGYSDDELFDRLFYELTYADDLEISHQAVESLYSGEKMKVNLTKRYVHKDGHIIWADVNVVLFHDDENNPLFFISHIKDITEKKKAEEALQNSESFLNSIIDQSPHPMWISDSKGTLIRINQACLDLLNISSEEVLNKYNVLKDDIVSKQGLMPLVESVYNDGKTITFQLVYDSKLLSHLALKNYVFVILEVTIFPVKDYKGKVTNAVIQHKDITERINADTKIKESLREKEVLLKEIHHRVKNNLQIISSLLDLQEDYVKEDTTAVNVLKESQNRVLSMAMIHEMLYQSKDLNYINFADYIKNLVYNLFNSYGVRNITSNILEEKICLNIETSVPLGLIVSELVSNSLKYAFPTGKSGEIFISLKPLEDTFELIISDNGVGLPDDFDFSRTDSTLGIRLVKTLVGQLDGKIELDRSQGTKYTINFKELIYKSRL